MSFILVLGFLWINFQKWDCWVKGRSIYNFLRYEPEEASTYNGSKIVYSINAVGKIGQFHAEKKKLDHLLKPHTRINSKWIKDLNIRPETIKILEENIGSKSLHIAHSNILSDVSPQARETKENVNKWDYAKLKSFCIVKEIINKIKRKPQNGNTYSPIYMIKG